MEVSEILYGDCLELLNSERLIEYKGKIDLIYIDPPYGTNNTFYIDEKKSATISTSKDIIAYEDKMTGHDFLLYIRERVEASYEYLSNEGTIYVHIGTEYSAYFEVFLDEIFGYKNRISRITRVKCNPKNSKNKSFGNVHDIILVYAKEKGNHIWNDIKIPYSENDERRLYKKEDEIGRYTTIPLHAPGITKNGVTGSTWRGMLPPKGRHWRTSPEILEEWEKSGLIEWSKNGNPRKKKYAKDSNGMKVQDVWYFKDKTTHYPTEKNNEMIEMIIKNSSKEDSIVMDFFAGSGTVGLVAKKVNRNYILIDKSEIAINIIRKRLQ